MAKELTTYQARELEDRIAAAADKYEVTAILNEYLDYRVGGKVLGMAFEKMFVAEDFSKDIKIETLKKIHPSYETVNGATWNRADNSYLGKKYNLVSTPVKGKLYSVRADGPNKGRKIRQNIRKDIADAITKQRCAVLDVRSSHIECDHKDGMKDDHRLADTAQQKLTDFQPLSKAANDAKRNHCSKCISTKKRYDARQLGYTVGWVYGDENTTVCKGCYWYDPKEFNRLVSANFNMQ